MEINNDLINIPADRLCFVFTNYNAFSHGENGFNDLPQLEPIFARSLEEAKIKFAKMVGISPELVDEWSEVGEEDGFTQSLNTGYVIDGTTYGYSFDVSMMINALALLK